MPRGRPKKQVVQESSTPEVSLTITENTSTPIMALGEPDYGYDILEGDDVNDDLEKILTSVIGRRKNQTIDFSKIADVRENMLPIRNFHLQWALGTYGIPHGCLVDIIGAEGLGKTTLSYQIMGWAMDSGCPAFYIECENKQLPARRILRALHTNKQRAEKMLHRLRRSRVYSLEHLEQEIMDYVNAARGKTTLKGAKHIPHRVPIVIVVDPWSKLLNADEAMGFYGYGDNLTDGNKAKFKAAGTASNQGHAKWAQAFCRRMPYFLRENNVILILVHHQNEDVDMGAKKGGPALPQLWKDLNNTKKIGGRAFNQNAAIQFILARASEQKNAAKNTIGKNIVLKVHKNSFGPDKRQIGYTIRTEEFNDTDEYFEPAVNFDESTANWMAEHKFFGTTLSARRFTCESLGVMSATASEFCDAFNANQDLKNQLGNTLSIEGYIDTVELIRQQNIANKNASPAPVEETPMDPLDALDEQDDIQMPVPTVQAEPEVLAADENPEDILNGIMQEEQAEEDG